VKRKEKEKERVIREEREKEKGKCGDDGDDDGEDDGYGVRDRYEDEEAELEKEERWEEEVAYECAEDERKRREAEHREILLRDEFLRFHFTVPTSLDTLKRKLAPPSYTTGPAQKTFVCPPEGLPPLSWQSVVHPLHDRVQPNVYLPMIVPDACYTRGQIYVASSSSSSSSPPPVRFPIIGGCPML
jgi:sulfur relay (sulfurtransferase) DsrC/TusE family protein